MRGTHTYRGTGIRPGVGKYEGLILTGEQVYGQELGNARDSYLQGNRYMARS